MSAKEEEEEEEENLSVEQLLERLGLQNYTETFKNEQVDMETLVSYGPFSPLIFHLPNGQK